MPVLKLYSFLNVLVRFLNISVCVQIEVIVIDCIMDILFSVRLFFNGSEQVERHVFRSGKANCAWHHVTFPEVLVVQPINKYKIWTDVNSTSALGIANFE